MSLPSHGVLRYIREILAEPGAYRSVRTFGSLQRGGGDKTTFSLGHEGATVLLDVENLREELHLKPGSLYMVVGEISDQLSEPCLQARIARNVDGMDLHLFDEALKLHRQFLRQQQELHMPIDSSSEQRA